MDDIEDVRSVGDISDIDDEEDIIIRAPKRYIRDGMNPFEFYNDKEFKRRYRFDKDSILYGILPKIEVGLAKVNNRGLPISPVLQLLICLRFFATGSFQLIVSDVMSVTQPTVSRIVFRVSLLLASLLRRFIKMPQEDATITGNRRLFNDLGKGNRAIGIPGVDGAIDCTHIKLVSTNLHNLDEIFRNRKGFFSLNVQAVVGPRMEFLDIVPEWPGSEHDSRIFRNSLLYMKYRARQLDGILIGDRGYPCLPFLMTPVANPVTDEELIYNDIHTRTRIIVERTFGVWKKRFPCLSRGFSTKLISSTTIVVACAVLHNLSLIFNDKLPEDDFPDENIKEVTVPNADNPGAADGFAARELLIARMFP